MKKYDDLHIMVPISIALDWPTKEEIVDTILELYNNNGFKCFALTAPDGAWRVLGYPSKENYMKYAELFNSVKEALSGYDIELGWWVTLTIKNGGNFTRIVKHNGQEHDFACCPMDPEFIKRFSEDIARFAAATKPAFIFTEDDYSINAAFGCYCKYHLEELAKRLGKFYTREEILKKCNEKGEESIAFARVWRDCLRDSLVGIATAVRKELDKETPEVPMGFGQSGYASMDGDCTEAVCRAFAGENHTPFARFHGTGYGRFDTKNIPNIVYSPLFEKQRIKGDMRFYHEADTFPHTRYYRSGKQMGALMASVYSFGYDGSLFYVNQILDKKTEEKAYIKMFKREELRFKAANRIAKQCEVRGVEIAFDPFYNTYHNFNGTLYPFWSHCVGRFGIPYSTKKESVAFLDVINAKYSDDSAVMEYLSKTLFLDPRAVKALASRGFGKYLGVEIGESVLEKYESLKYDIAAREIVCEKFAHLGEGRNMHAAHMYSPDGMGVEYEIIVKDEKCEVVTELVSCDKKLILPAMTYFENELGGKVIVMGTTVDNKNKSQSLYNYRRQRLFQRLVSKGSDEYVYVKEEPDVFVIQNEAKEKDADFKAMLTLVNLCEDDTDELCLHLPPQLKGLTMYNLERNGEWIPLDYKQTDDGICLNSGLSGLDFQYILFK